MLIQVGLQVSDSLVFPEDPNTNKTTVFDESGFNGISPIAPIVSCVIVGFIVLFVKANTIEDLDIEDNEIPEIPPRNETVKIIESKPDQWNCVYCGALNKLDSVKCHNCRAPRYEVKILQEGDR